MPSLPRPRLPASERGSGPEVSNRTGDTGGAYQGDQQMFTENGKAPGALCGFNRLSGLNLSGQQKRRKVQANFV